MPGIPPRVTHAMPWVPRCRAPGLNWINRALRYPYGTVPSSLQLQFVGFYTRPFFPAHSFIKSVHCVKPADILSFPSNIHFHRTTSTSSRFISIYHNVQDSRLHHHCHRGSCCYRLCPRFPHWCQPQWRLRAGLPDRVLLCHAARRQGP